MSGIRGITLPRSRVGRRRISRDGLLSAAATWRSRHNFTWPCSRTVSDEKTGSDSAGEGLHECLFFGLVLTVCCNRWAAAFKVMASFRSQFPIRIEGWPDSFDCFLAAYESRDAV